LPAGQTSSDAEQSQPTLCKVRKHELVEASSFTHVVAQRIGFFYALRTTPNKAHIGVARSGNRRPRSCPQSCRPLGGVQCRPMRTLRSPRVGGKTAEARRDSDDLALQGYHQGYSTKVSNLRQPIIGYSPSLPGLNVPDQPLDLAQVS